MTWDEMVEIAARAAWDHHGGPVMWDDLRPGDRNLLRAEMDAALRALRAAGVVQVPREPTDAMVAAAGFQSQELGAVVLSDALSAGQIKPEGE
jgi:hypothetical protein